MVVLEEMQGSSEVDILNKLTMNKSKSHNDSLKV